MPCYLWQYGCSAFATSGACRGRDIDGKIRQVSPALEATDGRARALKKAVAPLAMDYEYGKCRWRVLYDDLRCPQLVVVGTLVGGSALVNLGRATIDSG
jgi:hypothetical protein